MGGGGWSWGGVYGSECPYPLEVKGLSLIWTNQERKHGANILKYGSEYPQKHQIVQSSCF